MKRMHKCSARRCIVCRVKKLKYDIFDRTIEGYLKLNQPGQLEWTDSPIGVACVVKRLLQGDLDQGVRNKILFMVASMLEDQTVEALVERLLIVFPPLVEDLEKWANCAKEDTDVKENVSIVEVIMMKHYLFS
jgi:hypothetical protein